MQCIHFEDLNIEHIDDENGTTKVWDCDGDLVMKFDYPVKDNFVKDVLAIANKAYSFGWGHGQDALRRATRELLGITV